MKQINRLMAGGRIDRNKTINFTFDGKKYQGYAGDTLASALLANDVKLIGRSFKYHRPRGIMSAGAEETNAYMHIGEGGRFEPNCRATQTILVEGMVCESQNRWPNLRWDISAINDVFSRFLPSGFYYKTFMWPKSLWMTYERIIRAAAGMGKPPKLADQDTYAQQFAHCDVLVAGGGAAGLAAALTAGRSGARVIIAEQDSEFGGSLLYENHKIDGKPAMAWVDAVVAELRAMPEVKMLKYTTIAGYYDYNFLTALERVSDHLPPNDDNIKPRQRFWKIRAKQVILAQGAFERPMVFGDNDRPGVMLASSLRHYINRYAVLPGKKTIVFCNNDSAYLTALAVFLAGGDVEIVDIREKSDSDIDNDMVKKIRNLGIKIHSNMAVIKACGQYRVTGVEICQLSSDGKLLIGDKQVIKCDIIAMSSGWNPTVSLYSQARGKLRYDKKLTSFIPDNCQWDNYSIGKSNGNFNLADILTEGYKAGKDAAVAAGMENTITAPKKHIASFVDNSLSRQIWCIPSGYQLGEKVKHFHEFQNDATAADIYLAAREGYQSVEHLKRYTTTGMGNDQGKTSNVNAIAIMSEARKIDVEDVGTTTFRPPFTPVTFGAVAGQNVNDLFIPARKTAIHQSHLDHGAIFEDVGDWKRARYFPQNGEDMYQAVQRECLAVRQSVGMLDASTLGKIDLKGRDAAKLLNMLYTNSWSKLGINKCRYGLMLNEHGMIFDDGVTTCIGENHYHMTTTTGGAARVLGWIEEWLQTEWPDAEVYATSVTEQWAVIALNGQNAKALLMELCDDINFDSDDFPFMSMRQGHVGGVKANIYRISFTGELAYEINIPARYGKYIWDKLIAHGKFHDLSLYGTEAMHVLRAEKGFIIVGQDTDGTATPMDVNMDWIVSKKKDDFIGKRSFTRSDTSRAGRKQLVGLLTIDPEIILMEGAYAVEKPLPQPPMDMIGYVTSSYMSPIMGRSIALAMIKDGFNRMGDVIDIAMMDGKFHKALITGSVFFDKKGERSHG